MQDAVGGEMGMTRCSGLCKDLGHFSVGIQHGDYREVSVSFLFIFIQKVLTEC